MALSRRDDTLTDAQGRALSGAQVYYLNQPANVTALTPLAVVASDLSGTPATNPQITDGFGSAYAYLPNNVLYTIVFVHPLLGQNVVRPDQTLGGGSGGVGYTPFAEVPAGTKDGFNTVFTLSHTPVQLTVWKNFPLIQNLGYTLSGTTLTFAQAPATTDDIYASYLY